jgi:SAM-dependent methyltransferase
VEIDPHVRHRCETYYETYDEDERLWRPGQGDLVRLRTWDIFDRLLPPRVRIADVGGGPGTHAAYLASAGHEVLLFDPVSRHVNAAEARSAAQPEAPFHAEEADARELPLADASVDVVLLMGPLYHLIDPDDRLAALKEASRVLRPGGHLLAEAITRCAWVMDAARKRVLDTAWDDFEWNLRTGYTTDPSRVTDGDFWAYMHRPDEFAAELDGAGYADIRLLAVEGFAWLLDDLPGRMSDPSDLLRAVRLTEAEPSMLGASAHLIGHARRRGGMMPQWLTNLR